LPFGMDEFFVRVDADIDSVVQAAIAHASLHVAPAASTLVSPDCVAPSSPESPPARPVRRAGAQRACNAQARQRIQATLEWEACDEDSSRFLAVAQQYDDAFEKEVLDDDEDSEDSGSDEGGSESDDDDSYESSFVTDGSGSEENCSDDEWTPQKRVCLTHSADAAHAADAAHEADAALAADAAHAADAATHASAQLPADASSRVLEPTDDAQWAPSLPTFLHMEEFGACTGQPSEKSGADVRPCPAAPELEARASEAAYLHAEELDSPPGFYNLWVL